MFLVAIFQIVLFLRMKYGLRLIIFSQIAVVKIRRINMVF